LKKILPKTGIAQRIFHVHSIAASQPGPKSYLVKLIEMLRLTKVPM